MAIALYCALIAADFDTGIRLAVNHDGDSDSTGAITGNLLGARWGQEAIARHWLTHLEARDCIEQIATDLITYPEWDYESDAVWKRYPGY